MENRGWTISPGSFSPSSIPPAPASSSMTEAPHAELMRSLGRLVRGLSSLFWGLPITLIVCYYTASVEGLTPFGMLPMLPPLLSTGLLVYGLWQLGDFQKQERVWRNALDRSRLLSLINFGLSPFLFWWHRIPANLFFLAMVIVLALSAVLFLASINQVLQRLGAMLPDEALRQEIKQFTALNLSLLAITILYGLLYFGTGFFQTLPERLAKAAMILQRGSVWFLIPLVLLPLAMTMALIWKTKQVILDSVFGAGE